MKKRFNLFSIFVTRNILVLLEREIIIEQFNFFLYPLLLTNLNSLVDLYSKWLVEDNTELTLNDDEVKSLQAQLKTVKEKLEAHKQSISDKESSLVDKENRLKVCCLT